MTVIEIFLQEMKPFKHSKWLLVLKAFYFSCQNCKLPFRVAGALCQKKEGKNPASQIWVFQTLFLSRTQAALGTQQLTSTLVQLHLSNEVLKGQRAFQGQTKPFRPSSTRSMNSFSLQQQHTEPGCPLMLPLYTSPTPSRRIPCISKSLPLFLFPSLRSD